MKMLRETLQLSNATPVRCASPTSIAFISLKADSILPPDALFEETSGLTKWCTGSWKGIVQYSESYATRRNYADQRAG